MDDSRYTWSLGGRVQCLLVSFGISGIIAWLFYRSLFGMVCYPIVCIVYTRNYKKEQIRRQKERMLYEFKDMMQALSAAILAGYSMENAWRDAERELEKLHGEASVMRREVHRINAAVRMNEPIEECLLEFAKKSGCEEIESFAEVFVFAKRSGGDFVKIIQTTVKSLTGKIEVEQEIATVLAGKKLEGQVMNVMPILILAYMTLAAGNFLDVLYGNFLGRCIMTTVLVGYVFTRKLSARILDIKV